MENNHPIPITLLFPNEEEGTVHGVREYLHPCDGMCRRMKSGTVQQGAVLVTPNMDLAYHQMGSLDTAAAGAGYPSSIGYCTDVQHNGARRQGLCYSRKPLQKTLAI